MQHETPPPWSTDDLATLRRMFGDKCSDKEIADALGKHRTPRAVAVKRHTLGLVFYRRRTRPTGRDTGWAKRSKHFEDALDTILDLVRSRASSGEIEDAARAALAGAPNP